MYEESGEIERIHRQDPDFAAMAIPLLDKNNEDDVAYQSPSENRLGRVSGTPPRPSTTASKPFSPTTSEQDDAVFYYAKALLHEQHESKQRKLKHDQELEIDNLMLLLSRDAKEKREGVLGVAAVKEKSDDEPLKEDEDDGIDQIVIAFDLFIGLLLLAGAGLAAWLALDGLLHFMAKMLAK